MLCVKKKKLLITKKKEVVVAIATDSRTFFHCSIFPRDLMF